MKQAQSSCEDLKRHSSEADDSYLAILFVSGQILKFRRALSVLSAYNLGAPDERRDGNRLQMMAKAGPTYSPPHMNRATSPMMAK